MRDFGGRKLGTTPYSLRWPDTPEFTQALSSMSANALDKMLESVWKGYLSLKDELLEKIDVSQVDEERERSITQLLELHIRDSLTGYEAFYVQHGTFETETKLPGRAQSPAYDLAFILRTNRRIMWPLEAKIMRTPANIAPYVKDINNEFLTGRYAPFSRSAAMLGYLLSGAPENTTENIEKSLEVPLIPHPAFHPRFTHHTSEHRRNLKNETWASGQFTCHHMIMPLYSETSHAS